jgi:hypothetical protein
VVELDDLRGRIGHGVEERGQQDLRAEAPPLGANGAGGQGLRQFGVRATKLAMDGQVDEPLLGAQALADLPLEIFLGAGEPVPLRSRGLDLVEEEIGHKPAIQDGE